MEDKIVEGLLTYIEKNAHQGVTMQKSRFVMSQTHGHIGVSPYRIMYDPSESNPGVWRGK